MTATTAAQERLAARARAAYPPVGRDGVPSGRHDGGPQLRYRRDDLPVVEVARMIARTEDLAEQLVTTADRLAALAAGLNQVAADLRVQRLGDLEGEL